MLVVDDDSDIRLRELLERSSHLVAEASDGREGHVGLPPAQARPTRRDRVGSTFRLSLMWRPGVSEAIDPGADIGHVHLKLADIERALGFYRDGLGFEVMQRRSSRPAGTTTTSA
jgi:hypothetical protein